MDGEIWRLTVRTCMKGTCSSRQMLSHRLLDTDGQQIAFCQEEPKEDGQEAVLIVSKPRLWSPEEPALYSLETILADEHGQILQTGRIRVGFR